MWVPWLEAVGARYVCFLQPALGVGVYAMSDEERAAYAAWGLGRSNLRHFAGRRSLGASTRRRSHAASAAGS